MLKSGLIYNLLYEFQFNHDCYVLPQKIYRVNTNFGNLFNASETTVFTENFRQTFHKERFFDFDF